MKKIVGILAVAAMATSMFAVDVAASAKLSSNLFSFNTDSNEIKVFDSIGMENEVDTLKFGVTSDSAGASFRIRQQEKGAVTAMNIWFKPMDNLKLSFLENGLSLAADKVHWWDYYKKVNVGAGYGVEYGMDALTINLNIVPAFVSKANKDADVAVGGIGAKVGYAADFGNIAAIAYFADTFKEIDIGASYANNFSGFDLVVDAGVWLNKGLNMVHGMVYGGYNMDALSFQALANVLYRTDDKKAADKVEGNVEVAAVAKVGYQMDAVKLTAFFNCDNLLFKTYSRNWTNTDTAAMKIGLEIAGNVGIASWTVTPQYNVYNDTASVAFATSVSY